MVNAWNSFLILCFFPFAILSLEGFSENLFISSLKNGDIITIFNFTLASQHEDKVDSIYIPWLFFHLTEQFSLDYFKLSIAQGFWRTNLWGYQHINTEVPCGTELSVKFSNATNNTDQKWHDFVHLINGLFCTSILGLLPQFSVQSKFDNSWWYGALGGESVCTENLQSWKKLLPCKKRGLVSLLKPTFFLSARFHSISVELNRQSIGEHSDFLKLNLISKTVHNYGSFHKQDLIHEGLFNSKSFRQCPVSIQSRLLIEKNVFFDLDLSDSTNYQKSIDNLYIVDLNNGSSINLSKLRFTFKDFDTRLYVHPPTILMHSFLKSISQIGGFISTHINNPFPSPFYARFTQMLPWQIHAFLHTLIFVCTNSSNEFTPFFGEYTLSRDGIKPLLIELDVLLPANSKCKIEFEFKAAFLKISEFPPDANSGIHVSGAVLLISQEALTNLSIFSTAFDIQKIFGEPLLILLPVPDFSMPFNVICFVCTTIAIFYGNVFALSTKLMKLFPKEKDHMKGEEQKLKRTMKERILGIINLFSH